MKRYFAVMFLFWIAALPGLRAASADDQYIQIFNLIQEADSLSSTEPQQALAKYREAQTALQKFQKDSPSWSPSVVSFRLDYLATKISSVSKNPAPANEPASSVTPTSPPAKTAPTSPPVATMPTPEPTPPAAPKVSAPDDWEANLNVLKEEVRQLQADKGLLEAKLKEAFAAQPAQTDPRELTRAQDQLKALQKENDLLKASMETAKSTSGSDPKAPAQTQQALAEANRQLAEQKEIVSRLTMEKQALVTRMQTARTEDSTLASLRAENQALQKRVTELQEQPANQTPVNHAQQVAKVQAEFAALQSDKEVLQRQIDSTSVTSRVLPPVEESSRIKELERERNDLQKRLEASNKELYGRKGKALTSRMQEMENQVTGLQAKLEVFEARAVPYTTEELALFNKSETKITPVVKADRKSLNELAPGAALLVAQGQRYYKEGEYGKAEASYSEALRQDQKNVPMLTDLAAIELGADHLDAAEATIKQALALEPDSAYALSVLGRLRFRQGKYDESLDALSRAAKLEPANAEIQNFLGQALNEKGMRVPAEAALRKAVELEPNYATAHNNLAVVYITGKPPAVELARWHYQRALAAGAPHNPDLEKLLAEGR